MELIGDVKLIRKFKAMPAKFVKKYGRRALTKAGRRIVKVAKTRVPKRTGQLKKSLGQKGKTYKDTVVVIVGPRTGYAITDETGKRHDPAKIAHLVERGTAKAPAHPFLRPAYDETEAETKALIASEIRTAINESRE